MGPAQWSALARSAGAILERQHLLVGAAFAHWETKEEDVWLNICASSARSWTPKGDSTGMKCSWMAALRAPKKGALRG